jgi:hypothetical protein
MFELTQNMLPLWAQALLIFDLVLLAAVAAILAYHQGL